MTLLDHTGLPRGTNRNGGQPRDSPDEAQPVRTMPDAVAVDSAGEVVRTAEGVSAPHGAGEVGGEAARRHALWFFWMWLLFAVVISIGGNVIHAWMTAPGRHLRLLAAVTAAVPPAVLLGSTHSVALLIKTRRNGYRRTDALVLGAALLLTVGVAVCAFAMSFFSLRDLMILVGMGADIAWLWPVAVDLSLVCSTLALLSLTAPQAEGRRAVGDVSRAPAGARTAAGNGPSSPAERRIWWESIAGVVRERTREVRKISELSVAQIGEILQRLYDKRDSRRAICSDTNLHHREIRTIEQTADKVLARVIPDAAIADSLT